MAIILNQQDIENVAELFAAAVEWVWGKARNRSEWETIRDWAHGAGLAAITLGLESARDDLFMLRDVAAERSQMLRWEQYEKETAK